MQKTVSIREEVYNLLDNTFDDFQNCEYMSYGDLIAELIKEHKAYRKIMDGVN